jgi:hypothetical protein
MEVRFGSSKNRRILALSPLLASNSSDQGVESKELNLPAFLSLCWSVRLSFYLVACFYHLVHIFIL